MARIRTIKPEFCTSEQIAECSANARLLFILMWCFCDDGGVHPDSAKRLKMECFPADDITSSDVAAWIDELVKAELVERYSVDGEGYLRVTGWKKHQKIDQPTYRFPQPNGVVPAKGRRASAEDSSNIRGEYGERSVREGKGKEGNTNPQTPLPSESRDASAAPVGQDDIDQIRIAVWRQSGLTEDQIATKLVSMSGEGIRQARTWLESHPLADILSAIAEAYDGAEKRGEAIRKPWPYLDQVVGGIAERKAQEAAAPAVRDKWKDRRALFEAGMWPPSWGAQPGQSGCDAPQWVQEIYLDAKKGKAA